MEKGGGDAEARRTGHSGSSIGVEVGIDLVKEVERRRIAFLDRKDCKAGRASVRRGQNGDTCAKFALTQSKRDERFLSSRQLL